MAIATVSLPSAERVREVLDYCPQTGALIWRERLSGATERELRRWNARYAGKPVQSAKTRSGHCQVFIDGRAYYSHRIAWLHFYGSPPAEQVDHANNDPSDNRISNLRAATHSQNASNSKCRVTSKSGVKGVYWNKSVGKWHAQTSSFGRKIHLGFFTSIDAAASAYREALTRLRGEFARAA